jgi:5-methylcytosine-specific restriction endonuclease McrA
LTKFERLSIAEWDRRGYFNWAPCEDGCGRFIERGTVPHHSNPAGLGGRRKHVPELFEFLCRDCHDSKHF